MLSAAQTLRGASVGTIVSGLIFVGVGVASVAVRGATFSWEVGLLLVSYGALVIVLGALAWRRIGLTGLLIGAGIVHVATALSYASGPHWFVGALVALLPLGCILAALHARVASYRDDGAA